MQAIIPVTNVQDAYHRLLDETRSGEVQYAAFAPYETLGIGFTLERKLLHIPHPEWDRSIEGRLMITVAHQHDPEALMILITVEWHVEHRRYYLTETLSVDEHYGLRRRVTHRIYGEVGSYDERGYLHAVVQLLGRRHPLLMGRLSAGAPMSLPTIVTPQSFIDLTNLIFQIGHINRAIRTYTELMTLAQQGPLRFASTFPQKEGTGHQLTRQVAIPDVLGTGQRLGNVAVSVMQSPRNHGSQLRIWASVEWCSSYGRRYGLYMEYVFPPAGPSLASRSSIEYLATKEALLPGQTINALMSQYASYSKHDDIEKSHIVEVKRKKPSHTDPAYFDRVVAIAAAEPSGLGACLATDPDDDGLLSTKLALLLQAFRMATAASYN